MFIFFACPKKTNQQRSGERKGSRSLGQPMADYPALLESAGSLKTRFAQTVQTPYSADSVLLGCVKWHKKHYVVIIKYI